jgi:hypothetical protein
MIQSGVSARFRIAAAALCAGKPDGYIVCGSGAPANGAAKMPLCSQIEAPGA